MPNLLLQHKSSVNNSDLNPSDICIDEEFENRLLLHIYGNIISPITFPIFLSIQGPMGEGKTLQTISICKKNNINFKYFSGSELAGSLERDSVAKIEEAYKESCFYYELEKKLSIIIIDDFHLSIASCNDNISRTVNSQLLTGYLMKLADEAKYSLTKKIPIILIANDFTKLHIPLTRDGRMDFYTWKPTLEQKKKIISKLFENIINREENSLMDEFINEYIEQSIAFYAEVKNDIYKYYILNIIKQYKSKHLFVNKVHEFGDELSFDKIRISLKEIEQYAKIRLDKLQKPDVFLEREMLDDRSKDKCKHCHKSSFTSTIPSDL